MCNYHIHVMIVLKSYKAKVFESIFGKTTAFFAHALLLQKILSGALYQIQKLIHQYKLSVYQLLL